MNFANKIDKLLIDNNIKNLRQLAQEIDIPYTTLWDYYSNPIRMEKANLTYIKKIADKLGCTIDYLAYDEITEPDHTKTSDADLNQPLVDKYKILFDKDNVLTDEQKNFMLNFIKEQHEKIDKKLDGE